MVTAFEFDGVTVAIPTALHVFVGPNDVGKTRLLRAICSAHGGEYRETLAPPFDMAPSFLPGVEAEFRRRFPGHDPATSGDGMRRMFRLLMMRARVVALLAFDNPACTRRARRTSCGCCARSRPRGRCWSRRTTRCCSTSCNPPR